MATSTCTNPLATPLAAERVLVIRLGAVGDVVRTVPAATALRAAYPHAHLAWLVEPASASVLEGQAWLDEVLVFPRSELRRSLAALRFGSAASGMLRVARTLRERRFDLVVDFHAILKSGALGWLTRAPQRASYAPPFAREGSQHFATHRARLSPKRQSRFERNAALVAYLGVAATAAQRPLALAPERVAAVRAALGAGPAPVAIHPGTSDETPYKRWTAAGYAAVARALAERDGVRSLVTVGPARDDRAFAAEVVAASRGAATLAPPTPSLLDLAALFAQCRAYLGSDSGPMHVASLVGTPVVQLLGPTDPVENTPYPGTPSRSVRVQIACNPCRRGCAAATCMQVIEPAAVVAALRELLAGPRLGC